MELDKILAISGKPGLFKIVAETKIGVVVESMTDKKRFTAFAHQKISTLKEISVFTEDEDIPLKDVLKKIFEKQSGEKTISHKSDAKELKSLMAEILPNYDRDRVYTSDIKKIVMWYNLLQEQGLLEFEEEKSDEEKPDEENAGANSDEVSSNEDNSSENANREETQTDSEK